MNPITEMARQLVEDRQQFVLATIVSRHGSTPRMAGTRMIITTDGRPIGTIGGGLLEAQVVRKAREILLSKRPVMMAFDMKPSDLAAMDMICGGRSEVLLEFVDPARPAADVLIAWDDAQGDPEPCYFLTVLRLAGEKIENIDHCLFKGEDVAFGQLPIDPAMVSQIVREHSDVTGLHAAVFEPYLILIDPVLPTETVVLFGAGHVAQPTAQLATFVGFRVQVVDDRAEFANAERFPEAEEIIVVNDYDDALQKLAIGHGAFVVIVTRGHLHDKTVLIHALRSEAAYIGMIGSRPKRDHIFKTLLKQGFAQADLRRVHCPVGLSISAETPEEIALSIVAELVQTRAKRRRS
jgi:xanthine dehydrogenase accessory factor